MDMSVSYRVAAVQLEPKFGDLDGNRRRIVEQASNAAEKGARLIVFPEMATTGYVWNDRWEIAPFVETIPGPTTEMIRTVTQKYHCYVVTGLPEVDIQTGAFYNSAVLIGPEGVVGHYRKTHLYAADPRWAREGNQDIPVFTTEIGRIALLICMDAMYFEPARIAALKGADIVAFPTNWVGKKNNPPSKTWSLRAWENGLYWVAANRWGQERRAQFTGGSAVIDKSGEIQDWKLSGDGIVFGEFHMNRDRRMSVLGKRRPKAYHDLLLHPYLWKEGETRAILSQEPFEVLVVQIPNSGTEDQILSRVRKLLNLANSQVSHMKRLIVFPEFDIPIGKETENDLDFYKNVLHSMAAEYRLYVAASIPQKIDGHVVPTAILSGPEGCIGFYHQVHLDSLGRGGLSNATFRTFELPFARVGLLTGGDAEFPESYRVLAKQGADIIAVSARGVETYQSWMQRIWAHENDVIMAVSTSPNSGGSLLFLHRQVACEGRPNQEELLIHGFTKEMTANTRSRPFLRRLKNHLYDLLVMDNTQPMIVSETALTEFSFKK